MTLKDLYTLICAEFGGAGYPDLDARGVHWVMDLDSYRQVRAACRAAGAVYPDDDDPEPHAEDRLFGLRVEVTAAGGLPHLEKPPSRGRG